MQRLGFIAFKLDEKWFTLSADNIIPKPGLALELGKSISLTEAEEEAVAREVHATHARIVSGPNPKHMDEEFLATAYPKVHENLKLITDERVIEQNPESHYGSMSSMKNLEDTDNFGDQFLDDKPTEDDQEKSKVVDESDSTIPDPRTKLDNALLKVLERHTADLIEKHSVLPGLESIQNQESEKSPKEIIRTKREQGEEKQDSTYFSQVN
ncbi:hypothetical protein Tco_0081952 [Tanacetum coccineum]